MHLRKLIGLSSIVSEWALRMLHGCSNLLGRRAAPTKVSPLPPIAAFAAWTLVWWVLADLRTFLQQPINKGFAPAGRSCPDAQLISESG